MNGKTTDNPIVQNHYHKQIFCSLFNISRENVITVELLLEYENCKYRTQFPNDYVLGHDNLFDALCLLLAHEIVRNTVSRTIRQGVGVLEWVILENTLRILLRKL